MLKRLLLIALIVSLLFIGCVKPQIKSPVTVAEWGGGNGGFHGFRTTEPFRISEAPWVIAWAFNPEKPRLPGIPSPNVFQIHVYQADPNFLIAIPVDVRSTTKIEYGHAYMSKAGLYYLEVYCLCGTYTIKVEAYQ